MYLSFTEAVTNIVRRFFPLPPCGDHHPSRLNNICPGCVRASRPLHHPTPDGVLFGPDPHAQDYLGAYDSAYDAAYNAAYPLNWTPK